MAKRFNAQRILRQMQKPRAKKLGRKREAHYRTREAAAKRRQEIKAVIAKLQLPKIAQEMVEKQDLPASQSGKRILRQTLRTGFLKNYEKRGGKVGARLKFKEKLALKLAEDSARIHIALWIHKYERLPVREAREMYRAAAEILKNTKLVVGRNKELDVELDPESKSIQTVIYQLGQMIKSSASRHRRPGTQRQLIEIANLGEKLVDTLYDQLPEFSQIGFQIIDKIVKESFGERE